MRVRYLSNSVVHQKEVGFDKVVHLAWLSQGLVERLQGASS
jgi:hypothetical protein